MKKYYLYRIKKEYIDELAVIEQHIGKSKADVRPHICLKDKDGLNWLVPVTSLDKRNPNYEHKKRDLANKMRQEKDLPTKVYMELSDFKGANNDYKNILKFDKAFIVKEQFVNKYWHNEKHLKASTDDNTLFKIEKNFHAYIAELKAGLRPGYFKYDKKKFLEQQVDVKGIKSFFYGKHDKQLEEERQRALLNKERKEEKAGKRQLGKDYKAAVDELVASGKSRHIAEKDAMLLFPTAAALVNKNQEAERKANQMSTAVIVKQRTSNDKVNNKNTKQK